MAIKARRNLITIKDTANVLSTANLIYEIGTKIIETNGVSPDKSKDGDGVTAYSSLPYELDLLPVSADEKATWNAKEPAIAKNTGFNKNLGTTAGTISEGNHTHAADASKANVADVDTKTQVDAKISASNETQATILTKIGDGTKISSAHLPSYVDDVLEFANLAALPVTGEAGKIYIALDTNKEYRWSGSTYVELVASPGSTDAVAEGSTNKYWTNARTIASVLTGWVIGTATSILATDTISAAFGKVQKYIDDINTSLTGKQATLVSGTNIKTFEGESLLGATDIKTYFNHAQFLALPPAQKYGQKQIRDITANIPGAYVYPAAWVVTDTTTGIHKIAGGTTAYSALPDGVSPVTNIADKLSLTQFEESAGRMQIKASVLNSAVIEDSNFIKLAKAYGLDITGESLIAPLHTCTGNALTDGSTRGTWVYLKAGTVSHLMAFIKTSGVYTTLAGNWNGLGLLKFDPVTKNATKVADTGNVPQIWAGAAGVVKQALTTPYVATEGLYQILLRYDYDTQTTAPIVMGRVLDGTTSASYDNMDLAFSTSVSIDSITTIDTATTIVSSTANWFGYKAS